MCIHILARTIKIISLMLCELYVFPHMLVDLETHVVAIKPCDCRSSHLLASASDPFHDHISTDPQFAVCSNDVFQTPSEKKSSILCHFRLYQSQQKPCIHHLSLVSSPSTKPFAIATTEARQSPPTKQSRVLSRCIESSSFHCTIEPCQRT